MGNLRSEEPKKWLAVGAVVLRLLADKIQSGKRVGIVAVGGVWVVGVVLQRGRIGVGGVSDVQRKRIGHKLEATNCSGFGGCAPEGGLEKRVGTHVMEFGEHVLIAV